LEAPPFWRLKKDRRMVNLKTAVRREFLPQGGVGVVVDDSGLAGAVARVRKSGAELSPSQFSSEFWQRLQVEFRRFVFFICSGGVRRPVVPGAALEALPGRLYSPAQTF